MWLQLLRFLYKETPGSKAAILTASSASGISRGMLLATINAAVASAGEGRFDALHLVAFAGFLGVFLVATYFAMSRSKMVVETMIQRLRLRICDKLLYTELGFVENRGTGALYARLTQDINRLSSSAITFMNALNAAVLALFCLIYIGWLTWIGLVLTLITIVAGVATYFLQERAARRFLRQLREKEAEFFDSLGDMLRGFKEIKISRAKHADLSDWITGIANTYRELGVRTEIMFIKSYLTTETFTFALIAALVFVLAHAFPSDSTTIFQFLAAILFLIGPLEVMVNAVPPLARAGVSLDNVLELERSLDEAIVTGESRARRVEPLRFDVIRLDGVRFRFTSHESDDRFDLGPVDLELRRGEIVFVVGGNGSGKTTLLKLITGLYRPVAGRILVDGRALSDADYQAYREMFTAVFGDFHLFRRILGLPHLDVGELSRLLATLELDTKTHYEDGGFTTISLSTGQRKRLAYALCRLEDRQIYVFDEFGAEQDPVFRRFYYETLLPELKRAGKTVVAVTHDDAYFHACDRLIKMDYGRLVALDGRVEALRRGD